MTRMDWYFVQYLYFYTIDIVKQLDDSSQQWYIIEKLKQKYHIVG